MSLFEIENVGARTERTPLPVSELDLALTAQFVVAWAGETGEARHLGLGWWRSDLVSEFGGGDLFRRLLPGTWPWAVLQGAREAARRRDTELRRQDHDPDRVLTLYRFGFELDERIEERLQDLKRSGREPAEALPGLASFTGEWDREAFIDWVDGHGQVETTTTPIGRRLRGTPDGGLDRVVRCLVAALAPVGDVYPLPHFRRTA